MSELGPLKLNLHKKQGIALKSTATELLYGGAAGGGKSHLGRVASIIWCARIPGLQVYLFRREYPELKRNHLDGSGSYPNLLNEWAQRGLVKINYSSMRIVFPNRSTIHLCHAQNEQDVMAYKGVDIHMLILDEVTEFLDWMYRFLRSCMRTGDLEIPDQYKHMFPRILGFTNPGGPGHNAVKKRFITAREPYAIEQAPDEDGGMLQQFIPAFIEDNPTISNDPTYRAKLMGQGDPALVRARLRGDWDIVSGGALDDVWDANRIIIPTIDPPKHWGPVYRSLDWGSSKPFSVGWTVYANGESMTLPDGTKWCPPAGTAVRLREWYGCVADKPNVGLKMTATEVAREIKERERAFGWEVPIEPGAADSAIYATDEGEDVATKMESVGVEFIPAVKGPGSRKRRLETLRDYLKATLAKPMEDPGLFICACCRNTREQLPVLPRDPKDSEAVDKSAEDHIFDELTYELTVEHLHTGVGHVQIG